MLLVAAAAAKISVRAHGRLTVYNYDAFLDELTAGSASKPKAAPSLADPAPLVGGRASIGAGHQQIHMPQAWKEVCYDKPRARWALVQRYVTLAESW
jgi:hypothetical protein